MFEVPAANPEQPQPLNPILDTMLPEVSRQWIINRLPGSGSESGFRCSAYDDPSRAEERFENTVSDLWRGLTGESSGWSKFEEDLERMRQEINDRGGPMAVINAFAEANGGTDEAFAKMRAEFDMLRQQH
jgi:hypothetical protein